MTDVKALAEEMKKRNIDSNVFNNVEEIERKRLLGDDYQDVRTKFQWVYDQPISEQGEKDRENRLKKEQEQAKEGEALRKQSEQEQAKEKDAKRKELEAQYQERLKAEQAAAGQQASTQKTTSNK